MQENQILGVHHGGIAVSNIEQSIAFYSQHLGFTPLGIHVIEQKDNQDLGYAVFGIEGIKSVKLAFLAIPNSHTVVELLEYEVAGKKKSTANTFDPGVGHFCLKVRDVEAMHHRLSEAGVTILSQGPTILPIGPNMTLKLIYLQDPDGYIIELIEEL
ncbi:VOC family protein [Lysinibacillus sp. LZ02]|uniref:VOC family protein n=1 Tax=Lysinibacillus sp. LZ02 TaxID=3420668 RepID=UPI003D35E4A0